jgi:hypothetical protein
METILINFITIAMAGGEMNKDLMIQKGILQQWWNEISDKILITSLTNLKADIQRTFIAAQIAVDTFHWNKTYHDKLFHQYRILTWQKWKKVYPLEELKELLEKLEAQGCRHIQKPWYEKWKEERFFFTSKKFSKKEKTQIAKARHELGIEYLAYKESRRQRNIAYKAYLQADRAYKAFLVKHQLNIPIACDPNLVVEDSNKIEELMEENGNE